MKCERIIREVENSVILQKPREEIVSTMGLSNVQMVQRDQENVKNKNGLRV